MSSQRDYRVKNIALAELGREAIRRAEKEMPGLMALRTRYGAEKPLQDARITGSLHMTVETAVLIETLRELGAGVRWSSCNIHSTHDGAAAALAAQGIPIFAWKGESLEEYWWCLDRALEFPGKNGPNLIVDDGGDATWMVHEGALAEVDPTRLETAGKPAADILRKRRAESPSFFRDTLKNLRGISEETTTGAHRLKTMLGRNELRVAAIDVNSSVTKSKFDNIYGSRESLVDALRRTTHLMLAGKRALICGFGDVGKGSAESLSAAKVKVCVSEIDPICALQAQMSGYDVVRIEDVVDTMDIIVTATGNKDIVTLEHLRRMKDGAIVCNIGHFDCEIQVDALNSAPGVERSRVEPGLDRYTFTATGRSIFVLGEGRLVNLACADGHPAFVMSCSFSNQVLAQIDLWTNRREIGLYALPKKIDEEVAKIHVEALGGKLTRLSRAQAEYMGVAVEGPFKADNYRY